MKITLPIPPGVNNLYVNIPGRGRVTSGGYQRWKDEADGRLWGLKIKHFEVPVNITLTVEDSGRRDIDGTAKAPLDFLVRHKIIQDDSRKYVRKLTLQFGDVTGCEILVEAA